VATGLASHLSATTLLTVVPVAAVLAVSPATVTAGQSVRLVGSNFIPGESVIVQLSGAHVVPLSLAAVSTSSSGSFSIGQLPIPATVSSGSYVLTALGQVSGRSTSVGLRVNAPAAGPVLSLLQASHTPNTPYKLYPGGLATIAGSHFPAGAVVRINLLGPSGQILLVQIQANAAGAVGPLGVTIPATTKAGAYILEATVGGARLASLTTVMAALSPTVALSTSALIPAHSLSVHGTGFAAGEQVVLALNGNALRTTPTSVLADGSGAFTATFVVPNTVNDGANLITVTGVTSRATVAVRATANLPVASSWYFPHGDTTGGTRTEIAVLNPGNTPAAISMTFLYPDGPAQHYTTRLGAHSQGLIDLGLVAGSGRHMATILTSDRQIGAQSTITFAGADNSSTVGASGPATTWYLAEGYTNGSFREYLQIMNPNDAYATVDVRFLPFNNKPARETRFVMRPLSSLEIDAGSYMPGLSISSIVTADRGIVVERSMRFGQGGRGAHDQVGATTSSTVWSFAQGESSAQSQTFYTVLNPNQAAPAAVTATFFDRHGTPVGAKTIIVDPLHRGNIKLNDILPQAAVAATFTSNVPVVVERPIYQGPANLALDASGSVVLGRSGGSLTWTFPYVATNNGNQAHLYLFNPSLKASQVHATFFLPNGGMAGQDYLLAPNSVSVIDVNSVPNLPSGVSGAVLKSTNGQVFLAELGILNPVLHRAISTQGISQ
jgi:hypothetical protein